MRTHCRLADSDNNQKAVIALEPLTTHPDVWAEPSHK